MGRVQICVTSRNHRNQNDARGQYKTQPAGRLGPIRFDWVCRVVHARDDAIPMPTAYFIRHRYCEVVDNCRKEFIMPRGDKSKYTDKQKRKAEHIAEGYRES